MKARSISWHTVAFFLLALILIFVGVLMGGKTFYDMKAFLSDNPANPSGRNFVDYAVWLVVFGNMVIVGVIMDLPGDVETQ